MHLEVVRFLVESGANIGHGHLEVVRFLGGARSQQAGYRLV